MPISELLELRKRVSLHSVSPAPALHAQCEEGLAEAFQGFHALQEDGASKQPDAAGGGAGAGQRFRFRVRAAAGLSPAAADHPAAAHDDAADRRVRPRVAEAPAGERQGGAHVLERVGWVVVDPTPMRVDEPALRLPTWETAGGWV